MSERSKEAVGMMALHEALRTICLNSDWTYSVFWTIRPRPRVRGGNACKLGDDNGSLMLMWEDGYCRGRRAEGMEEIDADDSVRKAFSKMSIQLYNYGEGLMGKVASDKCHKWVFKEPAECESNISNYWQSSFDALPPEWADQFESGIQTIAVIQAGHGLLQLGSCKIIPEDLHFILRMRHTFESLGYQSGFHLSQLFSATRNPASANQVPLQQPTIPAHAPSPLFNWGPKPLPTATSFLPSPTFQDCTSRGIPLYKDEPHMFLMPHSSRAPHMDDMMGGHEADLKWPNGLTFYNALTGRTEETKLTFDPNGGLDDKNEQNHHSMHNPNPNADASRMHSNGGANANEFLSLDSSGPKMENKFKRSYTLPSRLTSSSSATSLDHHQHNPNDYRNESGM